MSTCKAGSVAHYLPLLFGQEGVPHEDGYTGRQQRLQHALTLAETFFGPKCTMASAVQNPKVIAAVAILAVAAVWWCKHKSEKFLDASDIKWQDTSAPYADEYETNTWPAEQRASATFSSDVALTPATGYGAALTNGANLPFANPTAPQMAYLANGSIAASLPQFKASTAFVA